MIMESTPTSQQKLRQFVRDAGLPIISGDELEDVADADSEVVPEGFQIGDEASANWLVRRIRECRQYADHVAGWAAAETRRAKNDERFLLEHYGAQLEHWAAVQIEKFRGRRRSLGLPAGTIGFRAEPPRLTVVDEAALIAWCRQELPDALRIEVIAEGRDAERLREWQRDNLPDAHVTEQVMKSVVNGHLLASGECPDGAAIGGGANKFFVR